MKTLFVLLGFVAFLALAFGYRRGMRRGCYDYDDDDDDMGRCGGGCVRRCGQGRRYESDTGQGYGRGREEEDDRVYRFQVGENFGGYEYLNDQGYLEGFYIDLLQAVCKKAGKKCAYILDTYEHCWEISGEREFPGVGLLDSYYDGCIGMLPSPDRLNSFNFTSAFTPNAKAALHWREKDEIGDKKNLTGRRIGFIQGWPMSHRCLRRQYNVSETDSFVSIMYKTNDALVAALLNKEVDAILTADVFDNSKLSNVPDEDWFHCTLRGLSVMTPYYSDVIGWWNCAFARLQNSGEFKNLCEAAKKKHGERGDIRCA